MTSNPTSGAPAALTMAQNFVTALLSTHDYNAFDASLLRAMTIISASYHPARSSSSTTTTTTNNPTDTTRLPYHPTVTTTLTIAPWMCNSLAHLHGGATATIFDLCTTLPLALLRRPGFWEMAGVSRSLSVTYLEKVEVGDRVKVVGECVAVGGRLAHVVGRMWRVGKDGKDGGGGEEDVLVAVCEHGKVNIDPPMTRMSAGGGAKL